MAFKGDLKNVQLADLFQTLAQNRQEGVLTLSSRGTSQRVHVSRAGLAPLSPSITGRRRLGEILVSAELVTEKDVEEALRTQAKTRKQLGEILVEMGKLRHEDLDHILQLQVQEEIYELFRIEGGVFEFSEGAPAEMPEGTMPVVKPLPVDAVVLEAARRLDEWDVIQKAVPSLEGVFVPLATPSAEPVDEEGACVLTRLDGRRDVRDVADALLSSPFHVAKVLARMVDEGRARAATPDELLSSAKAALGDGQKTRALKLLHRVVATTEPSPSRDSEISDLFRQAGDQRSSAQAQLRLARAAKQHHRLEEARRHLDTALREWPNAAPVLELLVEVLRGLNDSAGELRHTRELVDVLTESGDNERALKSMERVLELAPDDADSRRRYADLCLRARLKEKAIEVLEQDVQRLKQEGNSSDLAATYRRILSIDSGRRDIKRSLARLRRSRADRLLRLGLAVLVTLVACSLVGVLGFRLHSRSQGMSMVEQASRAFRSGDLDGARATLQQVLANSPPPEVWKASMSLLDEVDQHEADSTRTHRVGREQALNAKLAALQEAVDRMNFDTALSTALQLLREEKEPYLRERVVARLEMMKRTFVELVGAARARAETFREPERDEDVEAAFNRMNDVFPTPLTTSLERVRAAAFEGAKVLDDQPREWMHQMLAAVDSYDLVQARMKPMMESLRARYTRLKTLQQLSADYLEAARAAETGNIERSRALLHKVIDEYGQGELKPVLEKRLERLDSAARIVQEIEQHVREGDMVQAHAQALKAAEEYRDLQIPSTLGIPMQVRSVPSGARVRLDDQDAGTTPIVLRLPLGSHPIARLELDRYEPVSFPLDPKGDGERVVEFERRRLLVLPLQGTAESHPIWHENRFFVAGRDGAVHRIDPTGGGSVQTFATGSLSGSHASPVPVEDGVVVTEFEGKVLRIDARGAEMSSRWVKSLAEELELQPVRVGHEILVPCAQRLVALSLETGAIAWEKSFAPRRLAGAPVANDSTIFVPLHGGAVVGVRRKDHEVAFEVATDGDLVGSLVLDEHVLLATSSTGSLLFLDPATAVVRGHVDTGDLPVGEPLLHWPYADLSLGRRVVRVDVAQGLLRHTWSDGLQPAAAPALVDDTLWVSDLTGRIAAFGADDGPPIFRTRVGAVAVAGSATPSPLGIAVLLRDGTFILFQR